MRENLERIEVNITREQAAGISRHIKSGEYASTDEIVRESLRIWSLKKAQERKELMLRPEKSQIDSKMLRAILGDEINLDKDTDG